MAFKMYIIICETNHQSSFDAGYRMLGAMHWDDPDGWYGEGVGRGVQDGEHMYNLWQIHVNVWQNQYNILK